MRLICSGLPPRTSSCRSRPSTCPSCDLARRDAEADPLVLFLQPQVIIAGRQAGDAEQAAVDRQRVEAVGHKAVAADFQQRQFVALGLLGLAHVRHSTIGSPDAAVHRLVVGVLVAAQRPRVRGAFRPGGRDGHDVGQRSQGDPALRRRSAA